MLTTICSARHNQRGKLKQNGVHQAWLGLLLILGSAGSSVAFAQAIAVTPDQVLLKLSSQSRSTREAMQSTDITVRLRAASEELQHARSSGDSRYAGRAQSLLAALPRCPDVQLLRANVEQYQHRFNDAQATLDLLIKSAANHAVTPAQELDDAFLMSAQIAWVTGDFSLAKQRCDALSQTQPLFGKVCQLYTTSITGQLDSARKQLGELNVGNNSALRNWQQQLLADMADRAGDEHNAERRYLTVLTIDPEQHSSRAALADLYLRQQKFQHVIDLLHDYSSIDALAVRLLYARHQLGHSIDTARQDLLARYQLINARGDVGHEREQALLHWYLLGDKITALTLANQNFSRQKEMFDLRLLAQLSIAAHDATSIRKWRQFMQTTRYQDRQLDPSI